MARYFGCLCHVYSFKEMVYIWFIILETNLFSGEYLFLYIVAVSLKAMLNHVKIYMALLNTTNNGSKFMGQLVCSS